jgi:hypothetical protein
MHRRRPHERRPNDDEIENPRTRLKRRKQRRTRATRSLLKLVLIVTVTLITTSAYLTVKRWATNTSTSTSTSTSMATSTSVRLPVANVDIQVPNVTVWPLTHIINTRFMQEQGYLTTLGMARLHLFRTFCLPTMVKQSNQAFLWIVKTDPNLDADILHELLQDLEPYDNFYLVASNENFLINPESPGAWRDGAEGMDILKAKIYTGNLTVLHQAIALRESRPILETRLDADDGLHRLFVEYIQLVAAERFMDPELNWLYWCSRRHLEWHASANTNTNTNTNTTIADTRPSRGAILPVRHTNLCTTPGLTLGYNVDVKVEDVPLHPHDVLYRNVINSTECYSEKLAAISPCLELIDELVFVSIRSRTLTSAGMLKVDLEYIIKPNLEEKLWLLLKDRFAFNETMARQTQDYLTRHQTQIAYENLLGQCTSGHSCKRQAQHNLKGYIDDESKLEKVYTAQYLRQVRPPGK